MAGINKWVVLNNNDDKQKFLDGLKDEATNFLKQKSHCVTYKWGDEQDDYPCIAVATWTTTSYGYVLYNVYYESIKRLGLYQTNLTF